MPKQASKTQESNNAITTTATVVQPLVTPHAERIALSALHDRIIAGRAALIEREIGEIMELRTKMRNLIKAAVEQDIVDTVNGVFGG